MTILSDGRAVVGVVVDAWYPLWLYSITQSVQHTKGLRLKLGGVISTPAESTSKPLGKE